MTSYPRAELLVDTQWLEDNIDNPRLRIFDCAAEPAPNPDEILRKKYPLRPRSGRSHYEAAHIPGASHIDIPGELTDKSTELPMMMPGLDKAAEVIRRAGISNDSKVVLYSSTNPMWATRFWWILRAVGFDGAVILNGGLTKWRDEERPLSSIPSSYAPAKFTPAARPEVFSSKTDVQEALNDESTLLIHALTPSVYDGSNDKLIFGRRGHIPGSVNIPSGTLYGADECTYLPPADMHSLFATRGSGNKDRIVTYCGGGVNATNNAFALTLLGHNNVSVYDGSMSEWGNDPSLPVETT